MLARSTSRHTVATSDEREAGRKLIETVTGFADRCGFKVRAFRPYWAQTKGKIERPNRHMRKKVLYGRSFFRDAMNS